MLNLVMLRFLVF